MWSDKKSGLHILLAERILRKECYRIFTVLAFSCAGAKTFETLRVGGGVFFLKMKTTPFSRVFGHVRTGPKLRLLVLI